MLLFEDIQWADEASVALLRHVCREVADARILLLCTVRAPTPEASGVDLGDLAGAHVIRLAPFTVEEVAASVAAIAGGPVDGSWPVYVHRVSGGNPLFVRELVRLLATEGRLGAPAVDVPVPAQLRRVAMRRMARLGPACQELLGVASAMGDEIDVVLLTSTMDDDRRAAVPALLAEAVAAGVLVEDPESPGRLRFSHELVRRARYDELSRTERVGWHRRVADAIEATGYAPVGPAGWLDTGYARRSTRRTGVPPRRRAGTRGVRPPISSRSWMPPAGMTRRRCCSTRCLMRSCRRAELLLAAADSAYRAGQFEQALERCAQVAGVGERLGLPDLAVAAAVAVRGVGGAVSEPIVALCTRARALLGDEDSARHALVLAQHAYALAAMDRAADAARCARLAAH